jgi:large subunit ribosomal protein L9
MAKIILTQEVTGLGAPGDIVDVKDGYARNYLLPRRLGTLWTKGGEKQVLAIRKARRSRAMASVEEAQAARETLAATPISIAAKAGSTGRLFGTVTTGDIAQAVRAAGGPALDKRKIELDQHIKSVGEYQVTVHLHEGIKAKLTVIVTAA